MLDVEDPPTAATVNTGEFLASIRSRKAVEHLLEIRKLAEARAKVSDIVGQVCLCVEVVDPSTVGLETLTTEVMAFEAHDPEYSLDHFLADLALGGKSGAPTEGGGVKLATIHRTKGLQWPIVYLVGMEDGSLPNYYASQSEDGIREERRLCFVGVCRAEDVLNITRVKVLNGHPKMRSRFIDEMNKP
jgi:superfamily I DNA/RNA helicase